MGQDFSLCSCWSRNKDVELPAALIGDFSPALTPSAYPTATFESKVNSTDATLSGDSSPTRAPSVSTCSSCDAALDARAHVDSTEEVALAAGGSNICDVPVGFATELGQRTKQEDTYGHAVNERYYAIGVFDGHGGNSAAAYCAEKLCDLVLEKVAFMGIEAALQASFAEIEAHFETMKESSGCTAVVAVGPRNFGGPLVIATLGDCRAVVASAGPGSDVLRTRKPSNATIWMSSAQTMATERTRLEEAGVEILTDAEGVQRIAPHGLSTPGALGDFMNGCKLQGVSACPRIEEYRQSAEVVILGTDGIWEDTSSNQAARIVRQSLSESIHRMGVESPSAALKASELLSKKAVRDDNATVAVVLLDLEIPKFPTFQELQQYRKEERQG